MLAHWFLLYKSNQLGSFIDECIILPFDFNKKKVN